MGADGRAISGGSGRPLHRTPLGDGPQPSAGRAISGGSGRPLHRTPLGGGPQPSAGRAISGGSGRPLHRTPLGGGPQPSAQRYFYGALAVFVLACLVWGMRRAGAEGLAFGLCAAFTIGGSLVCIWERSIVRSAFSLLATFGGVAGLFVLLGADFLAMAQILIYVGGILALILFGVMLSPPDLGERRIPRVLVGLVLVGAAFVWVGVKVAASASWAAAPELPPAGSHAREIGVGFLAADQYVVAFELAAVLLTVALVAAVYIARRRASDLTDPSEGGGY